MNSKILGLLVAGMAFCSPTSHAVSVTVGSTTYDIQTITGTFATYAGPLESMPWWNDEPLSFQLASAVADSMGAPNFVGEAGPAFAYEDQGGGTATTSCYLTQLGYATYCTIGAGNIITWAVNVPSVAVPEPGTLAILGLGLCCLGLSRQRKA